jgi:predicted cupin superfamily sugar epimerase
MIATMTNKTRAASTKPATRRELIRYLATVAPGDDFTGYTLAELRDWAETYSSPAGDVAWETKGSHNGR